MTKSEYRALMKRRRTEFSASLSPHARAGIGVHLAENFNKAVSLEPEDIVATYWPMKDEVDPRPIVAALEEEEKILALPVTPRGSGPLIFRRWIPGDSLALGPFNTHEPLKSAPEVRPTVLIIPLLGFDAGGHRLGYGKGHYDKTIGTLRDQKRLILVGLAYEIQKMASLPEESHDERLDYVITEETVYKTKRT